MKVLPKLFENNQKWVKEVTRSDPSFFQRLALQQTPEYLWIGCSDSRVPANEIVGLLAGELFVHRNVANLVVHTDMNCLSVVQYAVEVLKVKHIIVCGHYGCGGVAAAMDAKHHGLIDNWLRHLRDVIRKYSDELLAISDVDSRIDRLCELNVIEQVKNVGYMTTVRDAWEKKQILFVHGWIYGMSQGLLKDLGVCLSSIKDLEELEK